MEQKTIKQSFSVPYTYQLYFTAGVFNADNPLFTNLIKGYRSAGRTKLLFVLDDGLGAHHGELAEKIAAYTSKNSAHLDHADTITVLGGERAKEGNTQVELVLKAINENAICRHSFVVAIGGGAVIDMVGYAAAIAHRGVKLIRVPTTVLAQNDAAVGVKNSVNVFGKKNFLGTFAPPHAIINDREFLDTLEQRDWISGIAEAIKVALLKDEAFFAYIEQHAINLKNREMEPMQYVIYKCAEMHMQHISAGGDPFEAGSSRPLDFGHWAAHKLEHMTGYAVRHGEAVAKGIALDCTYAHLMGLLDNGALQRILDVFTAIGFDISFPVHTENGMEELLQGIEEFREHLGGTLTLTLIKGLGVKHDVHTVDKPLMVQALKQLNQRFALNPS
ncbi:3-dehydroquinate synthase [Maribacter sp. 2307ULW6-5]|uniref:3-dehydroquinate synthase n=1 Tax=Maribacter sp. 2307ULW6-5 TaxID=3386275 RepID=UPI0039BD8221